MYNPDFPCDKVQAFALPLLECLIKACADIVMDGSYIPAEYVKAIALATENTPEDVIDHIVDVAFGNAKP